MCAWRVSNSEQLNRVTLEERIPPRSANVLVSRPAYERSRISQALQSRFFAFACHNDIAGRAVVKEKTAFTLWNLVNSHSHRLRGYNRDLRLFRQSFRYMVATQIRPWGFPEGDIWSAEIRILIFFSQRANGATRIGTSAPRETLPDCGLSSSARITNKLRKSVPKACSTFLS